MTTLAQRLQGISPSAVMEMIRQRRSVRKFTDDPVPDEDLRLILEAGRWGPSGANYQPWHFVVVRDPAAKRQLGQVYCDQAELRKKIKMRFPSPSYEYVKTVPVLIMVVGDPRCTKLFPYSELTPELLASYSYSGNHIYLLSLGTAIQNMHLMATALGYGSVYLTIAGETDARRRITEILGLPEPYEPIMGCPIGRPLHDPVMPEEKFRYPFEKKVHWDRWNPANAQSDEEIAKLREDIVLRAEMLYGRRVPKRAPGT